MHFFVRPYRNSGLRSSLVTPYAFARFPAEGNAESKRSLLTLISCEASLKSRAYLLTLDMLIIHKFLTNASLTQVKKTAYSESLRGIGFSSIKKLEILICMKNKVRQNLTHYEVLRENMNHDEISI